MDMKKSFLVVGGIIIVLFFFIFISVIVVRSRATKTTSDKATTTATTGGVTQRVATGPTQTTVKSSIWKSEDAGASFIPRSSADSKNPMQNADVLSIAFHPQKPNYLVVGTLSSGLYRSENEGGAWTAIPFPPQNIYSFILDKNMPDSRMFASGVLNGWGKVFRTDDAGSNWPAVYTEPGQKTIITSLAQNPKNPSTMFSGTSAGTVVKSLDGGITWKNIGNVVDGKVVDISFDANSSQVTYLLTYGKILYYSPNSGTEWQKWEDKKKDEVDALNKQVSALSKDKRKAEADALRLTVKALIEKNKSGKMPQNIVTIVTDPKLSGVIYAGTSKGLFKSTSYGKYWTEINIIESAKKFPIRSIAVNPFNSSEIVFVAGRAFYRSTNGGDTWAVTALDSDRDASFVAYDPFDPNNIYIGVSRI